MMLAIPWIITFTIVLLHISNKMRYELIDFKWSDYFNKCNIYQGENHWTTLKRILLKKRL